MDSDFALTPLERPRPRAAGAARTPRGQLIVLAVCAFAMMLDLGDIAISQSLGAIFSNTASRTSVAWLLSAVYVGGVAGAPVFGWLSDRYGRRTSLTLMLGVMAVTALGSAFSPGLVSLTVFRALSGAAFGGFAPILFVYMAELLPTGHRAQGSLLVTAVALCGPPLVLFMVRWLAPIDFLGWQGWRFAFLALAVLIGAACAAFKTLPESALWLSSRTRVGNPATAVSLGDEASRQGKVSPRRLVLFSLLFFLSPWATVAMPMLSGAVLIQKGFRLSDTLLFLAISNVAPILSPLLTSAVSKKLDRPWALALGALVLALDGFTFAWAEGPGLVLVSLSVFLFVATGYVALLNIYAAEAFGSSVRARAASATWAFNRFASILGPLTLLPLSHAFGPTAVATFVMVTLALSAGLVMTFGPRNLDASPLT